MKLISQAAEAKIYRNGNSVIKERVVKSYRHPDLDRSIRKFRTRREAKVLRKLEEIDFPVPKVISVDEKDMKIEMDFVQGELMKDVFSKNYEKLAKEIGKKIAQMHNADIVHGDLTTANMIVNKEVFFIDAEKSKISGISSKDRVFFIDFGLSQFSEKVEDKAVDLHVLEKALEAVHFDCFPKCFELLLNTYEKEVKNANLILKRLDIVRERGRNKHK